MRDVLSDINLNRSLEEIMDYILAQAGRLLGSQAIAIYRLPGENDEAITQTKQSIPGKDLASTFMPFGQAALRQALRTHRPVTVLCTSSQLSVYEETEAQRQVWVLPSSAVYQALLAIPIVIKKQIYGGVVLYYTEPQRFSQDEIELAVLYSNLVALAMENVCLREHLQQALVVAECNCLARELYDMVTQVLFSVRLIADALPRVLEQHPAEGRRGLKELSLLSRGALLQMRTLRRLPEALTEISFGALLRQLTGTTTSQISIPITLKIESDCTLSPKVQIGLYRIAEDVLKDAARLDGTNCIAVYLQCRPGKGGLLRIAKNGCVYDPNTIWPGHLRLANLQERARSIGAELEMKGQPADGTEISIAWDTTGAKVSDEGYTAHSRHDCG